MGGITTIMIAVGIATKVGATTMTAEKPLSSNVAIATIEIEKMAPFRRGHFLLGGAREPGKRRATRK